MRTGNGGLIRDGQSPALSIVMKSIMWSMLLMMGADDDDPYFDKLTKDAGRGWLMLTTPAILGAIGRDMFTALEWYNAAVD